LVEADPTSTLAVLSRRVKSKIWELREETVMLSFSPEMASYVYVFGAVEPETLPAVSKPGRRREVVLLAVSKSVRPCERTWLTKVACAVESLMVL
jgi:hypothetical protein